MTCIQCGRQTTTPPWCEACELFWAYWLFLHPEYDQTTYATALRENADLAESVATRR